MNYGFFNQTLQSLFIAIICHHIEIKQNPEGISDHSRQNLILFLDIALINLKITSSKDFDNNLDKLGISNETIQLLKKLTCKNFPVLPENGSPGHFSFYQRFIQNEEQILPPDNISDELKAEINQTNALNKSFKLKLLAGADNILDKDTKLHKTIAYVNLMLFSLECAPKIESVLNKINAPCKLKPR